MVLDRRLTLPEGLRLFSDGAARTLLFTAPERLAEAEQRFSSRSEVAVEGFETLADVLRVLAGEPYRVQSLIVEGGRRVLESFIGEGLWDEARVFTSGLSVRELYPAEAVPWSGGVAAPLLPPEARLADELPAVGLRVYEWGLCNK